MANDDEEEEKDLAARVEEAIEQGTPLVGTEEERAEVARVAIPILGRVRLALRAVEAAGKARKVEDPDVVGGVREQVPCEDAFVMVKRLHPNLDERQAAVVTWAFLAIDWLMEGHEGATDLELEEAGLVRRVQARPGLLDPGGEKVN